MAFFTSLESWFKRLFTEAKTTLPVWVTMAKSTLLFIAPLAETVTTLVAPEVAPAEAVVINAVQVGLSALGATLDGITAAPDASVTTQLTSILNSVKANLQSLLSTAQVKNPDSVAKITSITNLIINELDAILGAIAPAKAL